jgi:hypothetical protein
MIYFFFFRFWRDVCRSQLTDNAIHFSQRSRACRLRRDVIGLLPTISNKRRQEGDRGNVNGVSSSYRRPTAVPLGCGCMPPRWAGEDDGLVQWRRSRKPLGKLASQRRRSAAEIGGTALGSQFRIPGAFLSSQFPMRPRKRPSWRSRLSARRSKGPSIFLGANSRSCGRSTANQPSLIEGMQDPIRVRVNKHPVAVNVRGSLPAGSRDNGHTLGHYLAWHDGAREAGARAWFRRTSICLRSSGGTGLSRSGAKIRPYLAANLSRVLTVADGRNGQHGDYKSEMQLEHRGLHWGLKANAILPSEFQ